MRIRSHNKILLGAGAWLALNVAIVTLLAGRGLGQRWALELSSQAVLALIVLALAIQFVCFCWGGIHLARSRECPELLLLIGLLGPPAQLVLWIVLFALPSKSSSTYPGLDSPEIRERMPHRASERLMVSPRVKALIWILPGLLGIGGAIFLVLFGAGFFQQADNQIIAAMLVFFAGYVALLRGCWWLVKAKGWDDAVVFIGVMPLALFFIPFKRLVLSLVAPLLPAAMVMAPLILLVVVLVLPDKTQGPRRKHRHRR